MTRKIIRCLTFKGLMTRCRERARTASTPPLAPLARRIKDFRLLPRRSPLIRRVVRGRYPCLRATHWREVIRPGMGNSVSVRQEGFRSLRCPSFKDRRDVCRFGSSCLPACRASCCQDGQESCVAVTGQNILRRELLGSQSISQIRRGGPCPFLCDPHNGTVARNT